MVAGGFKIDGKYQVYKNDMHVFPVDYFSPITSTRVMRKTKNTYSIHYFADSWSEGKRKRGWRDWVITREQINALVQIKRLIKG